MVVDRGASKRLPDSGDLVLRAPRSVNVVDGISVGRNELRGAREQNGCRAIPENALSDFSTLVVESMTLTVHECPDELE